MQFAVEYELDIEYGGFWLFGKFCYWIKGQRIGDYEMGTSLRDILFQIELIIRDNGNRTNNELLNLDKYDLYQRLNDTLYGCDVCQYDNVAIEDTWARFNVTLPVDIFDGWKVFLVENKEKSRIIINMLKEQDLKEAILIPGEFDDVIVKVYEELNRLYKEEVENK